MTLIARKLLSEQAQARSARIFTRRYFPSKSNPGEEYEVRVYYGGTMEKPNAECSCPRFAFERWCGHAEQAWSGDLDYIARKMCTERDEIYKRFQWQ
ncbi:MAG: hypothetical protein KGL39_14920 [Patescibacteria group bacterium]|nr:hypothetical protein [Patescibacteria group bacterium]